MSSNRKSDFILLSTLIHKLKDNDYYRVFAKTLVRATNPADSIPPDNDVVEEMFHIFIRENELNINYNGSAVSPDFVESEVHRRASENSSTIEDLDSTKKLERKLIWEKEIYIKVQDLKKLYANKCIVFPKSLLSEGDTSKDSSRRKQPPN